MPHDVQQSPYCRDPWHGAKPTPAATDEAEERGEVFTVAEVTEIAENCYDGGYSDREGGPGRAEQAARQIQIYGRIIPVEETIAKIEEVNTAAVERVAARIIKSPLTLAAIGPTGGIEPYDAIAARFAAA